MNPFGENATLGQVFVTMMILDAVILLAGVYQYYQTKNVFWIVAAAFISAALIIIPAIRQIKREQERDNASR